MAEDSVEKEFDEAIKLNTRRKEAGKPSQEKIDFIMQEVFPSVRSDFIDGLGEQGRALEYLSKYKLDAQKIVGISLSRPLLCVTFLLRNVNDQCADAARDADRENNIEKFRFLYDFAIGSELVLSSIIRAEDELSGRGEEARVRVASYESKAFSMPASKTAERYLYMIRVDAGYLKLLREDPSGFLLIDSFVERVKTDTNLRIGFLTKEYALAGAETARDLYKKLYKIVTPLYPAKQSK